MIEEIPRTPRAPDSRLARESFAEALQNVEKLLEQPVINEQMLKRLIDIAHSRMSEGAKALPSQGGHVAMLDTLNEFDRIRDLVRAKGFAHLLPYEVPGQSA